MTKDTKSFCEQFRMDDTEENTDITWKYTYMYSICSVSVVNDI